MAEVLNPIHTDLITAKKNISKKKKQKREKCLSTYTEWSCLKDVSYIHNTLMAQIFSPFYRDFLGGAVVKNPPANAGDTGSSPGPGRSHMLQSN